MSSEPDLVGDNPYPPWLVAVAFATAEMVKVPKVLAKLRDMVYQWARLHAESRTPLYSYPTRPPTLTEKPAIIAAIHDRICTNATPIAPFTDAVDAWNTIDGQGEDIPEATVQELIAGMGYEIFKQDRVPVFYGCEPSIVEGWLEDVREGIGLARTTPKSVGDPDARPASEVGGYRSADWLAMNEGIVQTRLSEAVTDGKVRTVGAPRGMLDTQGRVIRVLYHRAEAIQHCKPKRTKAKFFPKAPRTNS